MAGANEDGGEDEDGGGDEDESAEAGSANAIYKLTDVDDESSPFLQSLQGWAGEVCAFSGTRR